MASVPTDDPAVGPGPTASSAPVPPSGSAPSTDDQPATVRFVDDQPSGDGSSPDESRRLPGRIAIWIGLAVVPWLWFPTRGMSGWFDLVAITLPLLIIASVIVVAWWGWRSRSLIAAPALLSLLVFAFVSVIGPTLPNPTGAPADGVRFMAANLESYWFSDNDFDWFLETHETSVLVASEIQLSHRDDLRARFEHYVDDVIDEERFRTEPDPRDTSYTRYGFPSVGVYSAFPLTELDDPTGIESGMPGMRLQVDLPGGPVILYALHVPKPALGDGQYQVSPGTHRAMADAIADSIRREDLPVVLLGDLNMTDRGGSYRSLLSADMADGMLAERARPTSSKGTWLDLLRLRIDHLLISDELCAESPRYDSIAFADHLVVSAVVGMCHDS